MARYSLFPSLSARLYADGKADPKDPATEVLDAETLSSMDWNEIQRLATFFDDVSNGRRADMEAALTGKPVPGVNLSDD